MDTNGVLSQKLFKPLQSLPEDIILEFLSKLPLTSLLTLRCVSKFWSIQFNENPKFIDMIKNRFCLMLIDDTSVCSLDNNSLSSSLSDGIQGHVKKIYLPLMGWEGLDLQNTNFVGSCHGLFCIYENKDCLCLWNPCTNEINFQSRLGFQRVRGFYSLQKGHGFGYDSKKKDYKYVCLLGCTTNIESQVHIYSCRTNTWKQMYVPYVPVNVEYMNWAPNGVLCNGALHWFARKTSYYPKVIIAFDMTEERVIEIPEPENLDIKKFGSIKYVDVLDGCLCTLYSNSAGFEVWVMKDYGKRESWTKMYSIAELTLLETESFMYNFFNRSVLVLYDPKNGKGTVLKLRNNSIESRLQSLFFKYVNSLVKLNSGSYVREIEKDQLKALSIRD